MLVGTAKNVGLVFVDVSGIGGRVLLNGVRTAFQKAEVPDIFGEQTEELDADEAA